MKKSTFSALLVAGAMILSLGASAQVVDGSYSQYDANLTAPTNIDYVTLKAGGTTMGYYALPDPVYHPNYNSANSWALTANFVWDWTVPTNPGTAATVTYPVATKPANYVEISYPVVGSYVVNVAEHAPAAFGGCVDATPTVMNVTVIAPPTATVTTADVTNFCGDQAAQSISISFVENIPDAMAAFAFGVNEVVETIDPSGNVLSTIASHSVVDFPTTTKAKTGTAGFAAATPNFTYGFNSAALAVSGGQRTRYTYTLVKASDAPGAAADGVISAISQKSDFVSGTVSTYPITDNQVVFIVNPTPSTGPIYHIANNFAY